MPSISLTVDLVSGAIIAVIGLLALQGLSRITRGIFAFFKPQVVVQRTSKSPFQVFLGLVQNLIILAGIVFMAVRIWLVYTAGQ